MILIDGKAVSRKRLERLKSKVEALNTKNRPGLCVVRVGEDPASKVYVGKKIKTCESLGFYSKEIHLPENVSELELLKHIAELNSDALIHGILVQLPLPEHISVNRVIESVLPEKDVDGFHPINLGRLAAGDPCMVACTPLGVMHLLEEYKIDPNGMRSIVIGRSRIVGRPMSLLLDQAGSTVSVIHKATKNPREFLKTADLIVVAAGKKHLLTGEDVKEGVVVIDVGIHRNEDGSLSGDVDFESVKQKASAITPVPGGVGPMTICSLLENTFEAFCLAEKV